MSDNRNTARSNVTWRGAIQVLPGQIVLAKIINFAAGGIQIQCSVVLKEKQTYQMMMEVPSPRDASQRTQVVCKATCIYTILSGSEYRAGMKYFDVPEQHMALLAEWYGG
ncbi:hypothetical protein [Undibacterium sp. TS12]|uniref:hypothetical protein n=1 Tax=Undibacterium sp. TS12 TaxID=2908202 RepID=UPI001F4CE2F4|nr:hypothetical protein [Undibacterium sp. TS12]MCH8621869.1 hypothetical protein [Undibacterium sp. TS12]